MPNALLEAAMLGMPIVSTPNCSGLENLVRNASGVWLTKDFSAQAIAQALCQALAEVKALAERTGNPAPRIPNEFVAPFEVGRAVGAYEELIVETARS
jgi:glycosyltransferase involved in cell wall biosynthesis